MSPKKFGKFDKYLHTRMFASGFQFIVQPSSQNDDNKNDYVQI